MRINRIKLNNFGSYEGENSFETGAKKNKNIVLIGGKNGAGKTTLFTAMRVCLYGFLSMGYKSANSYYNRSIIKLINNNAKIHKPCQSFVSLEIELNNGRGIDNYNITREWTLLDNLSERFIVIKNSILLSDEETADFEKYLLSLIPPELFNLYFFDGEKIAEFFFNEGSNTRIKNAFLTLCGYDTFEIMRKNFKRISSSGKGKIHASVNAYIDAKEKAQKEKEEFEIIQADLFRCASEIENCNAEIALIDKSYTNSGGITQDEWDKKIFSLKDEERKRENWNSILKKWANDTIPFLMITPLLHRVKTQIEKENTDNKCKSFIDILAIEELNNLIGDKRKDIEKIIISKYGISEERILDLSFEQSASLLAKVSELLDFDKNNIQKTKRSIKRSINKSAKIREELGKSNISSVQEYMHKRADLFERKSILLNQQLELEQKLQQKKESVTIADAILSKAQITLEEEIKKESISDISARAIIMLDKLQADLYHRQIEKIESEFRRIINILMRKEKFIDDIHIDDHFNIHVFRNELISGKIIKSILSQNSEDQFVSILGVKALQIISNRYGDIEFKGVNDSIDDGDHILPIEIDKESFSNGEKQIFIMALYYSLIQLGNHEIPFVIDTPFARIDTEHRQNIAKHFFRELKGQVFILSTNEEITSNHVQMLGDKILAQYMLENTDNKKTIIIKDAYFEV